MLLERSNLNTRMCVSGPAIQCLGYRLTSTDSVDDVGYLFFGKIGREVFAVAFCLCTSRYSPNGKRLHYSLILYSHDRRGRFRYFGRLDRVERGIDPRGVYGHLCRGRCGHRVRSGQYRDARQDLVVGVDRYDLDPRRHPHPHHLGRRPGQARTRTADRRLEQDCPYHQYAHVLRRRLGHLGIGLLVCRDAGFVRLLLADLLCWALIRG